MDKASAEVDIDESINLFFRIKRFANGPPMSEPITRPNVAAV